MNLFELTAAEIDQIETLCTAAAEEWKAAAAEDQTQKNAPEYLATKTILAKILAYKKVLAAKKEYEFCAARIDADYYNLVRADIDIRTAERKYENFIRSTNSAAAKSKNQAKPPEV